ncbi:Protein kinase domain-containing protein [Cinnamomum micranthum f. kanehirae]|uniref:Protein kinase domain-containing protein n=1 Tax=Cinnamomum micranthum f. kanehirae TaxID=337451 RepID=A0A3S3MH55_9MAGN|nr:Protein kinase domain-containing protein [Cinnamomum micranthum f. kanehirae]
MSLKSHPFFFFFNQRSLFCSSSAICFVSLGMSPFDLLFKKKKKKKNPIITDLVVYWGEDKEKQGWLEDGARLLKEVISSCDGRGCYPIRMFSAKEIEQAIGQIYRRQGFYDDYEGTHEDRQIIIKVYRIENREMAFNEIATVTQIKHANVAKLLGCCFETEKPILIYEKVPFILSNRLRQANTSSSSPISWEHRLRIAIEIAYAITYLHIGTSRPIVHRHIKSSNILLDEHYKPKLFDFSLSITIPLGETHVKTLVAGTSGYIDPEYAIRGIVSEKSDVYSYGVVLFELCSGKKQREVMNVFSGKTLGEVMEVFSVKTLGEVRRVFSREAQLSERNEMPLHLWDREEIDEKEKGRELISGNGLSMNVRQVEQAMACMELAGRCITNNPDERPAMKEVAQQLEQIERGVLPLSSSLLRVLQLATVGSSEGFSQIRTQCEWESGCYEGSPLSPR